MSTVPGPKSQEGNCGEAKLNDTPKNPDGASIVLLQLSWFFKKSYPADIPA